MILKLGSKIGEYTAVIDMGEIKFSVAILKRYQRTYIFIKIDFYQIDKIVSQQLQLYVEKSEKENCYVKKR